MVRTSLTTSFVGGQDVRMVSGRLGHANAATTLGIYAHFMEAADHKAADLMGRLLDDGSSTPASRESKGQTTDVQR